MKHVYYKITPTEFNGANFNPCKFSKDCSLSFTFSVTTMESEVWEQETKRYPLSSRYGMEEEKIQSNIAGVFMFPLVHLDGGNLPIIYSQ